jgi:hypothetical protein
LGLQGRHRAKLPSIGVLTGGLSKQELTDADATVVFDSAQHLRDHLNTSTPQATSAERRAARDAIAATRTG